MPLYTDPGYSYYSSSTGSTYSPYYTTPLYGSSSSSAYAPYSSTYNRSFSGTYTLPSTSRSNQYTSSVSRYHPKLSTITESPLTSRSNFIPLSRIQSPKVSTYSPTLSTTYISARTSRPKNISTADIDVSASSRYGRHHHMDNRPMEEEKADEAQATNNTDSDTSSSIVDPNSPFMPRVDGTDTAHHARSTIKRNRAVVRLSIMRPRSRKDENKNDDNQSDKSSATEPTAADKSVPPERFYISEQAKEEGLKITVTDIEQSKASKSSLSEMIIEVDPLTNIVRRLSVPQVPSFHDICEDISSDKIDDDLNAGVLRRRASLIQEQEIEILNELQKSQSGSIQVIHLERNVSQEDCRKSRKSKKVKKIRHKITAKVEVDNPPLTPVIQSVIEEENASLASPTVPKFTFNIEDIEEHKIFKLPKKRVKSIKSKKVEEKVGVKADAKEAKKGEKSQIKADQLITEKVGESQMKIATPMTEKALESEVKVSQPQTAKVASKPTPLDKPVIESKIIETQGTSAKLTTEKTARKLDHVEAQSKVTKTKPSPLNKTVIESSKLKEAEKKVATPKPIKKIEKSESGVDFWSEIDTRESWYMDKRKKIPLVRPEVDAEENPTQVPSVQEMPIDKRKKVPESKTTVDATPPQTPVVVEKPATLAEPDSNEDFWSQIDTRESLYMNKRKKSIPARPEIDLGNTSTPSLSQTTSVEVETESNDDFWAQIDSRESLYTNKRKMAPLVRPEPPQTQSDTEIPCTPFKVTKKPAPLDKLQLIPSVEKMPSSPTKIKPSAPRKEDSPSAKKALTKPEPLEKPAPMPSSDSAKKLEPSSPKTPTVTSQEKSPSNETSKKDDQPPTPKKTSTKPQDSPKTKNPPKLVAKKKSSPKNDAKEETAAESNSKPKAKPSASTTNEESIASTKINSGSGAKSPEKNKTTVKSDKQSITTKNATHTETEQKIPEISHTKPNDKQNTPTEKLKKSLAPTNPNQNASAPLANAKSDAKSGGVRSENANVKQTTCDTKMNKPTDTPPLKKYATSLTLELSPVSSPTTPETLGFITSPFSQQPPPPPPSSPLLSTPKPTADASTAQVLQPTTSTATTTKNSSPTPTAASTAPSSPTTKTIAESDVLASGGNNLSKFATISNLAQYLLDVDAEVEDYIPSSADESDSSSDSYSVDGSSLSASMKKKNKLMKKKAKEQQQAFDPNKKIKIDTKKKCYVKEEAPRYPLVATPRPLWKREKVTYEESSNSSSEETDSESECTTSDEYEDELCPKDAIIRMSTCSNDSGFDGGTAPATGKKVLETSYTYLQFQKSGRITAPATTIPRFKKYSVEDFHFLAVLGKGSFGKVLLAELRNTDFYYAVKCLKKDVVLEDDDVECTLIERKVLALGTKHPYLCHLFCTFQTESHLFFVMEYLNGGDLMFHIQESGRFPEDRARFYGAEIISGLKFLHKKGIIYRDLKLDNVLLDFDGHVRIADFGMCKLQIYLDKTADSFCGTPDYMAPEIIKGDKYNQNVDWWSFGVLLYEMLIGQSPFSGCDEDELFWSICNEIPWFPVYITQEATSILKGLLEKDYTRRVGSQYSPAGDICDHIFFKEIDWGLLEKRQLPPPFKPQVKHPLDTQYFDRAFTRERVRLTPIDKEILQSMDQEQFQGFSYTNPNATLD